MPGLFTGFTPSSALEGLKKVGNSVYDWATGADQPPPPYREPTIGPNTPAGIGQLRMAELGWDPEHFTDPNTHPASRVVGAVRDLANKTIGSPAGQALQAIMMFKTPTGEIDIPARVAATNEFREQGWRLPGMLPQAAEDFATQYPRVAAHMALKESAAKGTPSTVSGKTLAFAATPYGKVEQPVPVGFTPAGVEATMPSLSRTPEAAYNKAKELVTHEGTHVAQALGNTDYKDLYHTAKEITGYRGVPFEVQARRAGTAAAGAKPHWDTYSAPYKNAIEGLQQVVDQVGQEPGLYSPDAKMAAIDIRNILQRRKGTPMAPTTSEWTQEPR
jgi:hypothetical protein